jgi:hypothetical protein
VSEAEWRFAAGGQLEQASHGMLDLGWRKGPVSVQLFTDTLDLRLKHRARRGQLEVGLRGAAFAADMWITPWTDGAPDPSRAQRASYVGPEVRLERWLPHGTYVATELWARWYTFTPLPGSQLEVPDQGWLRLDGVAGGWWDEGQLQVRLVGGLDQTTERLVPSPHPLPSPHASATLLAHPAGALAPLAELRLVWAQRQDDVLATRLGGMTPYHVPLAGAAWAEFWVEDAAAARAGVVGRAGVLQAGVVLDGAVWTHPQTGNSGSAAGVGLVSRLQSGFWYGELSVGRSTTPRGEGAWPVSVWFSVGTQWRTGF